MAKMLRFKTVDAYIKSEKVWQDELIQLRKILNSTPLVEEVKWGAPTYTHKGKNVVGLAAFKDYFGIWFHQGVFLTDKNNVLINCQEGKTRGLRQWRMAGKKEIKPRIIKSYVMEAIGLVEQGKSIKPQRGKPVVIPPQLKAALETNNKPATAFEALTLGKKREYTEYIADAKREETKLKRLDKILPMIESGVGLNDKYR